MEASLKDKNDLGRKGELGKKGQLAQIEKHIEHHKNIHQIIKKHSPKAHKSARKLFNFKFPKLLILVICIVAAYFIFKSDAVSGWMTGIEGDNYLLIFAFGFLFSLGFTAPFSVGFFLNIHPSSIILAVLVAAIGATVSNMIIFRLVRLSFMDEFELLEKEGAIVKIENIVKKSVGIKVSHYLLYIFSGIIIASPLPNEFGVAMLAGLTSVKAWTLSAISLVLSAIGIYALLLIGIA